MPLPDTVREDEPDAVPDASTGGSDENASMHLDQPACEVSAQPLGRGDENDDRAHQSTTGSGTTGPEIDK